MQVVSGAMKKRIVHYEATASERLADEILVFLNWFNSQPVTDPIIKAAIAHLWFVTLHPFDDGNGRIRDIQDVIEKGLLVKDEGGSRSTRYSLADFN